MSCSHYPAMNPRQDRLHLDFKYPHNCYTTACRTSNMGKPSFEVCDNSNPLFSQKNLTTLKIQHLPQNTRRIEAETHTYLSFDIYLGYYEIKTTTNVELTFELILIQH